MSLFEPFPELETPRLLLRKTAETDIADVLFLRSDLQVLRYLKKQPMKDLDEARAFVAKLEANRQASQSIDWSITRRPNTSTIGSICLWNFSPDLKTGEVGYLLHPAHQGTGLMSEAIAAVVRYGFETLQLNEIEAFTHRENKPSLTLLQRQGFEIVKDRQDHENDNNVILSLKSLR